jgi:hypothetical protein
VKIDSSYHKHAERQKIVIQGNVDPLVIYFELAGCMIRFKHRLPNTEEVISLKRYFSTQGDNP